MPLQRRRIMKKKIRCVIWFLVLAFMLGGCTGKLNVQEPSQLYDDEVGGDGYIVVGFSQVGSESDWRIGNTESFRSIFTEENGYYLLFEDGQQKQENQLKAIRNFILQEVDYIVLDPIVETGWDTVLQEAKDVGIPVILTDRLVKVESEDLYICWVGSNFYEEGCRAGEWLVDYLETQGRSGETINIVTLQGTIDSSAQIGRTEGFKSILEEQENWKMLEYQSADFTQAKGKEIMSYFLEKYDTINVLVSENDNMTFGAVEAIREAGRTCGPDGDIIILSFDSGRAALEAMLRGEINADFECNPLLGPRVEEIIERLEKGEKVEKVQYVEEQYFDNSMDMERIMETRTY